MTDCLCNVGQRCGVPSCGAKGKPSSKIPGSAWCEVHVKIETVERIAIWQQRVQEQEERERAG